MAERKIGGITVCMIANSIVDTLKEVHGKIGRKGTTNDSIREYLFRDEMDKTRFLMTENEFDGLIQDKKSFRAKDPYVKSMFRNAILNEFDDIIKSCKLDKDVILKKSVEMYGLELLDTEEALSPQEEDEKIRKNNNIILWCRIIDDLEGKSFQADKYVESFKKHKELRTELEKLFNEMYPPEDKKDDYFCIDDIKKNIKILVVTDDNEGVKNVKKYAKKAICDADNTFSVEVTDEVTDEEFDIIYVIYNDGELSLDEIQKFKDSDDQDCIVRVFYNSNVKEYLSGMIKKSYIEYSDKAVYMLSVVDDVLNIKKNDTAISRRFDQRIEKLRALSKQNEKDRLVDHINSAKARKDWCDLLKHSEDLMGTAKVIYQEYIKEQKLLVDKGLLNKSMPEEIMINSLKANVDKTFFGDLAAIYHNNKDQYNIVKEASREKTESVYYLCINIGDYLVRKTEYKQALEFMKIASGISELMNDDKLVFESAVKLIGAYWRLKNYDEEIRLINSIEDKLSAEYSKDHKTYYALYRDMEQFKGSYLHFHRDLDGAIAAFKLAENAIRDRYPDIKKCEIKEGTVLAKAAEKLTATYNNMAIVYRRLLKPIQAEECYKESLAIKNKVGDYRKIAMTYRNMALLYYLNDKTSYSDKKSKCEKSFRNARKALDTYIKKLAEEGREEENEIAKNKAEFRYNMDYAGYCVHMGGMIIEDEALREKESYLDWFEEAEDYIKEAKEAYDKVKESEQLPSDKNELEIIRARLELYYFLEDVKEGNEGEEVCNLYLDMFEKNRNDEENHILSLSIEDKFGILYNLTRYYKKKGDYDEYRKFGNEMLEVINTLKQCNNVYSKYPKVIKAIELTADLNEKDK